MRSILERVASGRLVSSAALVAAITAAMPSCASGDDTGGAAGGARPAATTAPEATTGPTSADDSVLRLVAIGDSIPFNSANDCAGCTGFVDQYAAALGKATGRRVITTNLSQHNGLTLPMLMDELDGFRDDLSAADAIIVGIAHNSIAMNADKPCGATFDPATNTLSDWDVVNEQCSAASIAEYRPMYDELYSTIAGWRAGKPTLLRTIDKYSDWLGWTAAHLTPEQEEKTIMMHDAWNTMLCDSAEANGFVCADIYHEFNGAEGTKPSGELLGPDYTHPSQKGNDVIARTLISEGFAPIA